MQITGIDWTARMVEDYTGAKQFFQETLGLTLALEGKKTVMSHFRFPSGQLMEIYGSSMREQQPDKFRWFKGHALGLNVADVEQARQELLGKGVQFTTGIETWKDDAWSMFLGPEDNLLQIQTPSEHEVKKEGPFSGYSWFALAVRDFQAAVDFFRQVLGMQVSHLDRSITLAEFWADDGHVLQVIGRAHPWSAFLKGITIGFDVEDMEQVTVELRQQGVRFIDDMQSSLQGWGCSFFWGPGDYPYAIWQPDNHGR